ncbi:MAG: TolC family protein [Mariniblastus sp.]|nr:TolC family protein [Mariniblastus sp.]
MSRSDSKFRECDWIAKCICISSLALVSLSGCQSQTLSRLVTDSPFADTLIEKDDRKPQAGLLTLPVSKNTSAGVQASDSQVLETQPPVPEHEKPNERFAIDFPTVMRLAGADNWNVKIAREKVKQSSAELRAARAERLPSLNFGMGYNNHVGQIQSTEGPVVDVKRNSLFFGGGAGLANSPLTGGAGGPPRLFVDYSLAEAIFKPLAARQRVTATRANRSRVLNDTLLQASLAYYELVRAQSKLAIAENNHLEAIDVLRLTRSFVENGKGTLADISRVQVIVNSRQTQILQAQADVEIASAGLANVLQLDPCEVDPETGLVAFENQPLPLDMVDWSAGLNSQIDAAQSLRCEITQANAESHAASTEYDAEIWRRLLPNLYVGYSGGAFGGGANGNMPNLDMRGDFDLVLTWQLKNLGFGNAAAIDSNRSRYNQTVMQARQVRDKVSQQVTSAYYTAAQYGESIELLARSIEESKNALARNIEAIRGLEGLPLESVQSLNALASSRHDYLDAVINFNQWQLRLLRATGQPFANTAGACNIQQCCNIGSKCTSPTCGCQESGPYLTVTNAPEVPPSQNVTVQQADQ